MRGAPGGLASPPAKYHPAAVEVTEALLAEYPDLLARYGDRAREFGVHDTSYQLAWLVTATELGDDTLLRRDVLWLRDLLVARGFPLGPFIRNLELAAEAAVRHGFADQEAMTTVMRGLLIDLKQ
jgi:hypothetical protein